MDLQPGAVSALGVPQPTVRAPPRLARLSRSTESARMRIAVTCPSCTASFKVNETHAGKRGVCPKCRTTLQVPGLSTKPVIKESPSEAAPGPSRTELMERILSSFQEELPRGRSTFAYRLGILLVTAAMLLLPVLYVGLIVLVGLFVYWHATANIAILRGLGGMWARLLLYVAPLFAGVVLVLFMIKPLFAR